ncbi:MAG: FAD:protein FMN transferase, partial [Planctomycetales bacterium]|nr:FAD:protein FMN transferase [Planctomycetales bacterium]
MNRRRFVVTAGLAALAMATPARAQPRLFRWTGTALGAEATIVLAADDVRRIEAVFTTASAEIGRLERVFSLWRPDSALAMLNRDGVLRRPQSELVDLLSLCTALHRATADAFDPTVQPMWLLRAAEATNGRPAGVATLRTARSRTGFAKVEFDHAVIRFARPGMALTLNGVAQGYIADAIAVLLRAQGFANVLVNAGEFAAAGGHP